LTKILFDNVAKKHFSTARGKIKILF
jgi:hypothetical protein